MVILKLQKHTFDLFLCAGKVGFTLFMPEIPVLCWQMLTTKFPCRFDLLLNNYTKLRNPV